MFLTCLFLFLLYFRSDIEIIVGTFLFLQLASCFELQLSPSELTHSADLTCIMQNMPSEITPSVNIKTSVMNVSPEGSLRFWQNITRPAIVLESNLDLGGKICHKLLPIMVCVIN